VTTRSISVAIVATLFIFGDILMWLDLLLFLPLAILTNTFFPMPFDPVLLYFASRHSFQTSLWFAVVGSICAGFAGRLDIATGRTLKTTGWLDWFPIWRGGWFYLATIVFAFAPLPFSVVRLAAMRAQPAPVPYGLAIAVGRLPRYLLTVYFCQGLAVPAWFITSALLAALAVASFQVIARSKNRNPKTQSL
jgi:membrane protein YqaA with SNARE-associated domain